MKWFLSWQITSQTCIQRKWFLQVMGKFSQNSWFEPRVALTCFVFSQYKCTENRAKCFPAMQPLPAQLIAEGKGLVLLPRTILKWSKQLCQNVSTNTSRSCKNTHHIYNFNRLYMPFHLFTIMWPTTVLSFLFKEQSVWILHRTPYFKSEHCGCT